MLSPCDGQLCRPPTSRCRQTAAPRRELHRRSCRR
jgi:hypothetical protein